ncbi:DUF3108 domain-containing protein [Vicingus serpentipes]|uniref:DUF3108 domain-containing protein n=1 Tax=Vicingus serpentipes TaxID=1926625 RepID=A0A5C6RTY3_9FLAO|nr:DUF3108 domain-containing protein [Vicingus serpentipes]TXB64812.1 DUF3108 domain-containing protein [Vicingus serpentipes]
MKTKHIISAIAIAGLFSAFSAQQQIAIGQTTEKTEFRKIESEAYKPGEVLEYRLHYGVINAGTARLEVNKLDKKIAGREVYHVVGTGKSKGAFDWFFKVRDRYETFIDKDGAFPWMFVRDVNEGGYKIKQNYTFAQNKQKVITQDGNEFEAPEGIQDMLSSFYYARTIDFSNAKKGEIFTIWSFVDDEIWPLKIRYAGKEKVEVSGDTYNAMKFHPVIQTGRLFKSEDDVSVWISDDANKIPLLAQGKVMVGSVKMELTGYKGLVAPISKIDD